MINNFKLGIASLLTQSPPYISTPRAMLAKAQTVITSSRKRNLLTRSIASAFRSMPIPFGEVFRPVPDQCRRNEGKYEVEACVLRRREPFSGGNVLLEIKMRVNIMKLIKEYLASHQTLQTGCTKPKPCRKTISGTR